MAWSTEGTVVNSVYFNITDDNSKSHKVNVNNPKANLTFDSSESLSGLKAPYGGSDANLKNLIQDKINRTTFVFA